MTLDGASLLNVPLYELQGRNAERALDAQLARCAAQPSCRRAFPVHAPGDRRRSDRRKPVLTHPPGSPPAMLGPDGVGHTLQALLEVPTTLRASLRSSIRPPAATPTSSPSST